MLVIDNQSFELVTGGSKFRRKLLDWLVFHVKHGFHSDWLDFRESLKQRNAQLKVKGIARRELEAWLPKLVESGDAITRQRLECAGLLIKSLDKLFEVEPDFDLISEFDQGWNTEKSLLDTLAENLDQDLRYQTTRKGPHKADIVFTTEKKKVSEVLSRGQLKSVVCRFYLALCQCFKDAFGVAPILLIDDLPSELDQERAQVLINQFLSLGSQLFITGVELNYFDTFLKQNKHAKVFHVEHGTISEKTYGSDNVTA
jgi:DNA replication and repair protein RecF